MACSNSVRLLAALCVLVICSFSASWAETEATGEPARKNSLEGGAWAVQFRIDSDAILNSFGGSFSVKKHTSRQSAYRLGLDFGFDTSEYEREAIWPDTTITGPEDDRNSENIGLSLDYLRYTSPDAPVNFFWGAGPFGNFSRTKTAHRERDRASENVAKSWSLGLSGRLGVEWFATRALSFHAEYFASAYYSRVTQEYENTDLDHFVGGGEVTSTHWRFNRGDVLFGLSAYF